MFENPMSIATTIIVGVALLVSVLSMLKTVELIERIDALERETRRQFIALSEFNRKTPKASPSFSPSVSPSTTWSVTVSPSPEPIEDTTPLTLHPLKLAGKIINKTSVKICRHCATPAMGINQAWCEKCGAPLG